MKHKFIAIMTIIFLATVQQAVAQKSVQITDSLGNVWTGKQYSNGKWVGMVKVTRKDGGKLLFNYEKGKPTSKPIYINDKEKYSITGNIDEEFLIHDTVAYYTLQSNISIAYIVEVNHGQIVKYLGICDREKSIDIYGILDNQKELKDGSVIYRYKNAESSNIEVKGKIQNGKPEGNFIAYNHNEVIGNGTYKNGLLTIGTDVLGTNESDKKFHTETLWKKKETKEREKRTIAYYEKQIEKEKEQLNNNSSNHEFSEIYKEMHNSNISNVKKNQKKIVYQGLYLMKNGRNVTLSKIPDTKGKKYIVSIIAGGNFKQGDKINLKSNKPFVFVIHNEKPKYKDSYDFFSQTEYYQGEGQNDLIIYAGITNTEESFYVNPEKDVYISVVIMEADK